MRISSRNKGSRFPTQLTIPVSEQKLTEKNPTENPQNNFEKIAIENRSEFA